MMVRQDVAELLQDVKLAYAAYEAKPEDLWAKCAEMVSAAGFHLGYQNKAQSDNSSPGFCMFYVRKCEEWYLVLQCKFYSDIHRPWLIFMCTSSGLCSMLKS